MDVWAIGLGMQLITRLPHLLVWGGAMVLAVLRMQRHPKASKLLLAGASISVVVTLVGTALGLLPGYLIGQGRSPSEISLLMGIIGGGSTLVSAVGLGLVVASVFLDREPSSTRS